MTDEEQVTTPALGSLVTVRRKTPETDVEVTLRLGTAGNCHRQTGIGFLDHLLCAFGRLGRMDLELRCQGDLHVDEHHAIEAVAIGLGRAVLRASGVRAGIRRFASSYVPMDEALVRAVVDVSGRPFLGWRVPRLRERIGEFPVEMAEHFWLSFATHSGLTLHVDGPAGTNQHHLLEAIWKAVGRALSEALEHDPGVVGLPSTLGPT